MNIKLAFLTFTLVACDHFELMAQNQPNYSNYHQEVINAEEMITAERYSDALSIFETVFDSYDFIFLKDYKMATQLALHLEDEKTALNFLKLGISNGWTLKNIKKNKFLKPLRQGDKWRIIKSQYDSVRINYNKNLDQNLRMEVHQMFKKDQKLALGALFKIREKARDRYVERKFAPHSEKQMARLAEVLYEYGYPGERLIGNNLWMWTILTHHVSMTTAYTQKDTLYPFLKPDLLEAIRAGEMSPYKYAMTEDWYIAAKSDRREAAFGYLTNLSEKDLPKSNELRQNIGIRSIETRNNLVDIQDKTGMNFYLAGKGIWGLKKITVADAR